MSQINICKKLKYLFLNIFSDVLFELFKDCTQTIKERGLFFNPIPAGPL